VINLISRELNVNDNNFFKEIIAESPDWQKEECSIDNLQHYLLSYNMYKGEWRIWSCENIDVGISYILEWSPANEKPWLGTILIHPSVQRRGLGKEILDKIGSELYQRGHKAFFAACPIVQDSWLQFLGKCGFQQFKVEKDENTLKEYMITVKPLM
jgi:GNAT superfamily N-acetyltransferase